ncbi:MAG TPA: GNAT family N-acetyltransferase [Candidatus Saccharimonadia bacterium]|nr:GNAT family N-acetyltransferase [Candidatus Saccharimonadia bacterium]
MIDESFRVEIASWERDREQLRAVRESVFIVEQRVREDEEWDALDANSVHALARAGDGTPIGTGRLTPERMIGRMAVLKDWRGRGVGDAILRTLLEQARSRGWRELELHSQTHAIEFYQRHGFAREGDEFEEAGVAHFTMRAQLEPAEGRPATALPAVPDSEPLGAATALEAQACIDRIARDARHHLWIYSRNLDRALLDREAFIDQVRRLSLSGRGAGVRILLHEPATAVRDGHRLLHFAARLSSYVQLRKPVADQDRHHPAAFVLNDVGGYFHRTLASRFDGEGNRHGPGRHRQLLEFFNQVWERGEEDPELRRMAI